MRDTKNIMTNVHSADQDFIKLIKSDIRLAEEYSRRAREYHADGDLEMADHLRKKHEAIFERIDEMWRKQNDMQTLR